MLEKEFVPPQESLELKELGFDEPCLAWFSETKELQIAPETYKKWTRNPCDNSSIVKVFNPDCFTAPTFSQAFRWFREKYDLFIAIVHYENGYSINDLRRFETYEEAELACLRKLIEVAKARG